MKTKYIVIIFILTLSAVVSGYAFFFFTHESNIQIRNVVQSSTVFVALIAAVVALSNADRKPKKVKVKIESSIDSKTVASYKKCDLPLDFQSKFSGHPDPINSHRVEFKITNTSGFTLKKPTLAFRLPKNKMHPHKVGTSIILTFNSNLFNSQDDIRLFEFADTQILSNSNLPFWNNNEDFTVWVRMTLDDGKLDPFFVGVSINCENAEGVTSHVKIVYP